MTSQSLTPPLSRSLPRPTETDPTGPPMLADGVAHGAPGAPGFSPAQNPAEAPLGRHSRLRRNLAVMAIAGTGALALGFGGTALMNAFFTAQASVTGQQVTTGTVNVTAATAANSSPIQVTGLMPGDAAETLITVRNSGSEPVYLNFGIPVGEGADATLAGALQARLTVGPADGPSTTRSLTDWQSGRFQLAAPLAPGAETQVAVNASLPGTATDTALQAKSAAFAVNVTATQVKNTPVPTGNTWVAN